MCGLYRLPPGKGGSSRSALRSVQFCPRLPTAKSPLAGSPPPQLHRSSPVARHNVTIARLQTDIRDSMGQPLQPASRSRQALVLQQSPPLAQRAPHFLQELMLLGVGDAMPLDRHSPALQLPPPRALPAPPSGAAAAGRR